MFPGCSCKSDRPIKHFCREQAPRTHGTVHSGGACLRVAWCTKMYMQLLGALWGPHILWAMASLRPVPGTAQQRPQEHTRKPLIPGFSPNGSSVVACGRGSASLPTGETEDPTAASVLTQLLTEPLMITKQKLRNGITKAVSGPWPLCRSFLNG